MNTSGRVGSLLKMLESEPSDVFLNFALALEYIKDGGDPAQAERQLLHVLAIDGGYTPAYYQLGKLFENQNRVPEALETYRKGLVIAREKKDRKAGEFEEAIFLLED